MLWATSPYAFAIRRCSHRPSRYRWIVTASDSRPMEYATESYPTAQAAIEAGEAQVATLNRCAAPGYAPP